VLSKVEFKGCHSSRWLDSIVVGEFDGREAVSLVPLIMSDIVWKHHSFALSVRLRIVGGRHS
jgi:hypothetical protein